MIDSSYPIHFDPKDSHWQSFAQSFPQANIFHHPIWINLLAECYGYKPLIIGICDHDDNLIAGLPIMEINSFLSGRRWVSLPFSDYLIPLSNDETAFMSLINRLVGLYKNFEIPKVEIRWNIPSLPMIQQSSQFYLHQLHLEPDPDIVQKKFHRTQRQNIHTAEKNNIKIIWGKTINEMREFYRLHCVTRHKQGVPVQPWKFFKLILERLFEKDLGFILLAYLNGDCLAAGLFLHWGKTLTYKYASSSEELQNLRPNHLLTWTAIQWGCENGFKIFDFGRTEITNEGLRTYKNRWGVEETELFYSVMSKKTSQPVNGGLDTMVEKFIQKSPLWVCRLSGEILYRHFG